MKWVLVAIVMNVPVKTDLVFNSLSECMAAESQMRVEWSEVYSQAKKSGTDSVRVGQISSAMTTGTCVPSK
jgi:hypothetical protein